jgi:prevent-host-death family protein
VSRVIAQRDLRNQNAQILAAVEAGASFVVTRNGTPVAELRPLARGRRLRVPRAEIAAVAVAGPRIDAAAFRHDVDAMIGQDLVDE